MLSTLILANYPLEVKQLTLIDSHFGTEIFLLEANNGRYIVKTLPPYIQGVENEGYIAKYLLDNSIKVAKFLQTNSGEYFVKTNDMQFHVQEFIEGETLRVNTAPDWFLDKSAGTLGRIHQALKGYDQLGVNYDVNFFSEGTTGNAIQHYSQRLDEASQQNDIPLISELKERIRHLKRISSFNTDVNRMTYTNSHGDYHIGQVIVNNKELTVIDWTSACCLPAALEIILSYSTADPVCKNGKIDCDRLKRYIENYLKHGNLNKYDLEAMPYIYYFQQIICHYPPPYSIVADTYKPMCELINNLTNWLYQNVEALSKGICS